MDSRHFRADLAPAAQRRALRLRPGFTDARDVLGVRRAALDAESAPAGLQPRSSTNEKWSALTATTRFELFQPPDRFLTRRFNGRPEARCSQEARDVDIDTKAQVRHMTRWKQLSSTSRFGKDPLSASYRKFVVGFRPRRTPHWRGHWVGGTRGNSNVHLQTATPRLTTTQTKAGNGVVLENGEVTPNTLRPPRPVTPSIEPASRVTDREA